MVYGADRMGREPLWHNITGHPKAKRSSSGPRFDSKFIANDSSTIIWNSWPISRNSWPTFTSNGAKLPRPNTHEDGRARSIVNTTIQFGNTTTTCITIYAAIIWTTTHDPITCCIFTYGATGAIITNHSIGHGPTTNCNISTSGNDFTSCVTISTSGGTSTSCTASTPEYSTTPNTFT